MRSITTMFCVLSLVLLMTGVASAVPVTITDHSFDDEPGTTYPTTWTWAPGNSQQMNSGVYGSAPVPDGSSWMASMSVPDVGVQVSQVLSALALPNTTYTMTVDLNNYGPGYPLTFTPHLMHADGTPVGTGPAPASFALSGTSDMQTWYTPSFTWTTDGTEPGTQFLKIGFQVATAGSGGTAFLDNVRLDDGIPIPEPSTLALLATGLIGLLAYAWRKRR